ncbi:uncharacterized protein B0P05DRAFT_583730 [Gilbertella persicaria]|uniref:uncharacterized protein n=1 Tax=Gilbertella persicaria TaxID=101096 RepID=UPI00221F2F52|nr:uncharacterized protein B0P05DRAFT_583730 [Gilbertella persicaria]KAI8091205.1 hypothetical protein B0P05DRAFT_583730 [Gilbertella persicaria]
MNPSYVKQVEPKDGFKSLEAFYPFYLGEHGNKINRRLHVLGTSITMVLTLLAIQQSKPTLALAGIIQAYAFAWFGHFVFEQK